jgi:hypothetical protein
MMYKGRCPHCQRITPINKDQWYKSIKCQWCGMKFVPFATERKDITTSDIYKKNVAKSLEGAKVKFLPRQVI